MSHDENATLPMRRAGRSGLLLPVLSLGLWQNFGDDTPYSRQREIVLHALDRGITHIDLANNYGPPPGAAEESFGRMLATDLRAHRDELVVSTKAGYRMWPGPYGEGGSRKYLLASLDASLRRLGTDHVDVFYSHRYDPTTPLEETIGALATAVTSGRAVYAGISSYSAARTRDAVAIATAMGLRLTLHQPSYSVVNRWVEEPDESGESLLDVVGDTGLGVVAFSPLAQGLLTEKYLHGVPADSRAARDGSFRTAMVTDEIVSDLRDLAEVAADHGRSLAQLALLWALRDDRVTTLVAGARTVEQLDSSIDAVQGPALTPEELEAAARVADHQELNIWAPRSSDL